MSCLQGSEEARFILENPSSVELSKTRISSLLSVDRPFGNCLSETDKAWSVTRSAGTGYISSGVLTESRCASEQSRVRVSAWPGQRLNISVYDFNHGIAASAAVIESSQSATLSSSSSSGIGHSLGTVHAASAGSAGSQFTQQQQQHADCNHFAIVFETDVRRPIKICPGERRSWNVYVSTNHSVEIYFKRIGQRADTQRFLIQYTGRSAFCPFHYRQVSRPFLDFCLRSTYRSGFYVVPTELNGVMSWRGVNVRAFVRHEKSPGPRGWTA